jgi:hypothetical protein
MGESYKGLAEHPAWQDLIARCFVAMDSYYATLRSGQGNQDAARGGIEFIEWLMTIPANMILTGEDSEKELRRLRAERNGDG